MIDKRISRRGMLKGLGLTMVGMALAACAPSMPKEGLVAEKPKEKPAKEGPVTIRFSGWGNVEELTLYDNIAKAYMEENPNVKIETIGLPGSEYAQKLFAWIASGNPPDCIRTGTQYFPTLWADGVLLDLTPYFEATPELLDDKLYMTKLLEIYEMDGKKYATVIGPNVMATFLNMDLLEKVGLEYPSPEWTYNDYVEMAVKMTGGEGVRKEFGSSNAYWWMVWESMLWARGGDLFDREKNPTKCLLDSPEMIDTLRWLQDLVWTHKAAPTVQEASGLEGGWNSGRIGMAINGTWAVNAR
ncbi:MAG: extracellular solute-binding protein, partial [Anaerolineae bacterium]|nr:extracellular solute-binding protein [Anaerolineae bacterium]